MARVAARSTTIFAALAAVLALAAPHAQAQIAPYAMFSAAHYSGLGVGNGTSATQSGGITALGGTFGVGDDIIHAGPVHLGADARLVLGNSANSTSYGNKVTAFLTGARLAANPIVFPLRPYVQAEIGAVAQNNGTSTSKQTNFGYQVQFGGDWTLVPHIAARLEYGAGQVDTGSGTHHTLQTFGAGIVVRLF